MIAALRRPAGLRARMMSVVVAATVVAVTATTAGFNILLGTRLDRAADDVLRSRAQTEIAEIHFLNGRLTVPEAPAESAAVDQPVWVFAGTRAVERPRATPEVDSAVHALVGGPRRIVETPDEATRLMAVPVRHGRRRLGTVVAAVSLTPYRRTRDIALVSSLAFACTLLLVAVLATRWLLAAGLRPVARMTAQAAEWSEQDVDRRFALGPPHDELTQLAATLDGLLGRLSAALHREQRFSAELSHELRTPLARLRAQAQLALDDDLPDDQRDAWTAVLRSSDEMAQTLEALLAGARAEATDRAGIADARRTAETVAARHERLADERGVAVAVTAPDHDVLAAVDGDLLERLLMPLVDNACRYACSHVLIAVRDAGDRVVFAVSDDGPGVRADERERIFEPAVRGSAGTALRQGTGLGLALARRLAVAAGGSVEAVEGDGGGGCFVVRVPRA